MVSVRQDVATLGPGWNKTLLNYALAVQALDALPITDKNSWKFLGAMHGFDRAGWVAARWIKATDPIPAELTDDTFGDQCQHGSWFFLPWHRGYLAAFEAIVAATVKELTGDEWALPYWNYLDDTDPDAGRIPDAFLEDRLPDGSDNPLKTRYPRRPGVTRLPPTIPRAFTLEAMEENDFLVGNDGSIGFGGGITNDFVQFDGSKGDLERNPHDTVHGLLGGVMGNARTAGLDPIFWLHHCNVDRLWEAWMGAAGKTMTRDPRWRDGPADRAFIMPDVGGDKPGVTFKARDTLRGGRLHPVYADLIKGTGVTPAGGVVALVGMGPPEQQAVELVGASSKAIVIGDAEAEARVDLDVGIATTGIAAMGATAPGEQVSRLYLALKSVRGDAPSPVLDVYVNLPDAAGPTEQSDYLAGSLTLFGLDVASQTDGKHGGNGLGYTLDITEIAKRLQAAGDFDPNHLRVSFVPREGIDAASPVTIEQISLLKRTGTVG